MAIVRTAKEFVRHMISRSGLVHLHRAIRKFQGQNVDHLFLKTVPERFSAVYKNRVWLNARPCGTLSGLGSEIDHTATLREELPKLLRFLETKVLLDIGCGDFGWMNEVALPCRYIGVDVAEEVVARNKASWSSDRQSFLLLDAIQDPLPPADTVLCREVLFHLSFEDIWGVLENVRRSGASLLIATTDVLTQWNADILSGDFRILNLGRRPFDFPAPVRAIPDCALVPGRTLSAWRVADLPARCRK